MVLAIRNYFIRNKCKIHLILIIILLIQIELFLYLRNKRLEFYNVNQKLYLLEKSLISLKSNSTINCSSNSNLIHYWSFDNSSLNDQIGNLQFIDGKNYSFTFDRFNNTRSALSFENGYLKIPSLNYLNNRLFIITFWFKLRSHDSNSRLIDFGMNDQDDNKNIYILFDQNSNTLEAGQKNEHSFHISYPIVMKKWYFLRYEYSKPILTLYLNEQQYLSHVINDFHTRFDSNYIGATNSFDFGQNLNGDLDDLKIYNCSLGLYDEIKIKEYDFFSIINFFIIIYMLKIFNLYNYF